MALVGVRVAVVRVGVALVGVRVAVVGSSRSGIDLQRMANYGLLESLLHHLMDTSRFFVM